MTVREALRVELAEARAERCPVCHGVGEAYIPADTVYPQPGEWAPCPECRAREEEICWLEKEIRDAKGDW